VNINLKLNILEGATWITQVRTAGQYHIALGLQSGYFTTSAELLNRHHSKGSLFTTAISDRELDAMIERQSTLVKEPAARNMLIQDIQRKYLSLRGLVPIAIQTTILGNWSYIQDWSRSNQNAGMDYIHTWFDK
jgi:ABC-type transport system substrate-binding protein